jgi:hypothetical protein
MGVTTRRPVNPSENQPFRHASQLVGNMAFDRGRFVGWKATGLFASSETRNTRRRFFRSHLPFSAEQLFMSCST